MNDDLFFMWNWQEPDLPPILEDLSHAIADETAKFLRHEHNDAALVILINAFLFYQEYYSTPD